MVHQDRFWTFETERQQRQKKKLVLQRDLADKTKLSKSYLNRNRKRKKYPKHDKIIQLADVLNCKFDDLVSTKLDEILLALVRFYKVISSKGFR